MRLKLKRDTQEQIQEIFKTVSYHSNSMDRVFIGHQADHPLIDSLLNAHWKHQDERESNMARSIENFAKKATNNCNVDIRT